MIPSVRTSSPQAIPNSIVLVNHSRRVPQESMSWPSRKRAATDDSTPTEITVPVICSVPPRNVTNSANRNVSALANTSTVLAAYVSQNNRL